MFEQSSDTAAPTALVVDDDDAVRAVTVRMLDFVGVASRVASSGEEAVSILTQDPDAFAVVMLDLNLPTLSGESTFAQLRDVRPDIPVLFVSGDRHCEISAPGTHFLEKPFSIAGLRRQLSGFLDRDAGAAPGWAHFGTSPSPKGDPVHS